MPNLASLKTNESATIKNIFCDFKIKKRLLELGFINNTEVKVLAISSLKKTYLLQVMGSVIALRRNILEEIEICKK